MENPPSSPKEPEPKKLKMSTTTTSDDDGDADATGSAPEKKQRYKRRKIAIFFAYCGVGYQGMQKNPGAKTIEGDLEEALFLSGAVPEQDRGIPKRFDWARSARTDKGVSAVGQVVSGRFYIDPPGLVDRLNSNLPPQIRIFGYKRVTASFNAKKFCDRRRYVYLLPVFALDPCSHRDRESVLSSLGSGNELVKCLECSERGRKVAGVMGKRSFEPNSDNSQVIHSETRVETGISLADNSMDLCFETTAETGISSNNGTALSHSEVKEATGVSLKNCNNDNSNYDGHIDNVAADNEVAVLLPEVEEATGVSLEKCYNENSNSDDHIAAAVLPPEVKEATGVSLEKCNNENSNSDDHIAADNEVAVLPPEVKEATGVSLEKCNNENSNSDEPIAADNEGATLPPEVKEATGVSLEKCNNENSNPDDHIAADNEVAIFPPELVVEEKKIEGELGMCGNGEEKLPKQSGFCYGEKERERFNRILKCYEGTHNFHNFTTRTKAEDPSAKRFIVSFDANTIVSVQGIDFVKCEVVGQSFMLHQIRKMVGLAVAIMRNCAPESLIETAMQQDVNINVPTAPEVGLYLDECFFASYNQKWKDSHDELSMKAHAEEAEDFKMNHIYSHIASTEHKEGVAGLWLHSLNYRNYPDLRVVSNEGTSDTKSSEVEDVVPE